MAAGSIGKPGTEYGPCKEECHHRDCAELREMASKACLICAYDIGYDRRYYRESAGLVHASCAEDAACPAPDASPPDAPACYECGKPSVRLLACGLRVCAGCYAEPSDMGCDCNECDGYALICAHGLAPDASASADSAPVCVSVEDWCRLCDTLSISPDSTIGQITDKAESVCRMAYATPAR